ncbi:MAG: hypothetical protein LAT65_19755 [Saccharospirillum sp.]|nr:hypothetical protein [Saccharospirillum sp.]
MTTSLFDLELANIEDDQLHKPSESSENKRSNNHRKLAARRAIEDHIEQQRLRKELDDLELELF